MIEFTTWCSHGWKNKGHVTALDSQPGIFINLYIQLNRAYRYTFVDMSCEELGVWAGYQIVARI